MPKQETPAFTNIPPQDLSFNEAGLRQNINYVFRKDGRVDWRQMIPVEQIVPNRDRTEETDITKLDDSMLMIKLAGFRELADIRGFEYVSHEIHTASMDFVSIKTTISWLPNFETQNKVKEFSALADAHVNNTKGFGQNFLTSIAENRGFIRAVRGFLNVPIVGQDELGSGDISPDNSQVPSPLKPLETLLATNNIAFENFKNRMIKMGVKQADGWESLKDVSPDDVVMLMTNVKKALDAKAKK